MNSSRIQPDAFTRFHTVRYLLEKIIEGTPKTKKIKLLDIGGSSTYMTEFLKESTHNFSITVIDPLPRPKDLPKGIRYIQAGGETASDLGEKFDVTIMIDMLEHLPGDELKNKIIDEAVKVSKLGIVIAGPFNSQSTDRHEHLLNDLNKSYFGVDQNWLKEHFEYGKPDMIKILEQIQDKKWSTKNFATLPYEFWYASSVANLTKGTSKFINSDSLETLNSEFNTDFRKDTKSYFCKQGYREFIIAQPVDITVDTEIGDGSNYEKYIGQYVSFLSNSVFASQQEFTKLEIKHQSYIEDTKNIDTKIKEFERIISDLERKHNDTSIELEKQKLWRERIEKNPVYKTLHKGVALKRKVMK